MQPPLDDAELAELYPHLQPWQRLEMEHWFREHNEALMLGLEPPPGPPWPEEPGQ